MINWLAAFLGPMFAKEMIELSRRKRYYLMRLVLGLAILYSVSVAAADMPTYNFGASASNSDTMAKATYVFIQRITLIQFLTVYITVPMFLCGVVTSEREAGTLTQLFTTPLSDHDIIMGKLASRLMVAGMLVVSGIPILSMLTLLGGVSFAAVWQSQAVVLLAAIHAGCLAVYCATIAHTAFRALLLSYFALLVSAHAVPVSPPCALYLVTQQGSTAHVTGALFIHGVLVIAVAWFFVNRAARRLRDELPPRKPWKSKLAVRRQKQDDLAARPGFENQAAAVADRVRSMWGPLQMKIVESEPTLQHNLWVLIPLAVAYFFNSSMSIVYETETMSFIMIPIWMSCLTLLVVVAITNPLLTRRPGFFDLLLATRLEADEILKGTFLVSGPWLARLFAVPWTFGILWSAWNFAGMAAVLVSGTLFAVFILAVGNLCALTDQRNLPRLTTSITVPLAIAVGPFFIDFRGADVLLVSVAPVFWIALCFATRRRITAVTAGLYAAAIYFMMSSALVVLPALSSGLWIKDVHPCWGYSPVFWMFRQLSQTDLMAPTEWMFVFGHWLALGLSLAWYWHWALSNFDRATGRVVPVLKG